MANAHGKMKIPISVIIITYNETGNIAECIESVRDWTDEIYVVDSGSTDDTVTIAKRYTDKIYYHPFENFAQQRNWSQENLPIRNEWVLHLDADERISSMLARELRRVFSAPVDADGFMASRRTVFRGRWIRHGGHYPVYHLRIFKKDKGRSEQRIYDQNYIVNGNVSRLQGDIVNIIDEDLKVWKMKHARWACLEAQEVVCNKERIMNMRLLGNPIERRNWLRYNLYYKMPLFLRPLAYFFYRYIIRMGFLDGREGLIFHFWQGLWYRFLVDMRICEYIRKGKGAHL